MMRLCDREGIVVIDETTAVGLMLSFNFDVSILEKGGEFDDDTWKELKTAQAHQQVIRELIDRDKKPCMRCHVVDCQRGGDLFKRFIMSILSRYLILLVNWIRKNVL